MMDTINIGLKHTRSKVLIGEGVLSKLGSFLQKMEVPQRVVVFCDHTVARLYGNVVKHSLRAAGFKYDFMVLPAGEKVKSLDFARKAYKNLLELKVHRDSAFIALGGGVIGDFTGFISATYMRGTGFIQVPTTLLAQVDASIGGKTAVNLEEAKNIVGVFHQPLLVFSDVAALITLPPKEIRNGLAEVIKYGIIKDLSLFSYLERNIGLLKAPKVSKPKEFKALMASWNNIVKKSASIKAKVVMADEKETKGERLVLNLGHTIGHALEALSGYKGLTHGEAVAIGMAAAAGISVKLRLLTEEKAKRITALIASANLPVEIRDIAAEKIIDKLILDKKVRDGKVVFVLPKDIGRVIIRNDVPLKAVREVLKGMGAK